MSTTNASSSIDALLSTHAKSLKPGESISFTLVKGTTNTNAAATLQTDGRTQLAPDVIFPIMAKFTQTVTPPDFSSSECEFVLYEEEKAKARDSDDEEIEERLKKTRKRRPYHKRNGPKRHWVLHEASSDKGNDHDAKWLSRYEGNPENNPSHFALMSVKDDGSNQINVDLVNGFQNFVQPHKIQALGKLSDAAEMINSQKVVIKNMKKEAQRPGAAQKSNTRLRLMEKLSRSNADVDDADDVMADVAFRNAKVSVSSRRELLQVSDNVEVDGEGVIGGANDGEFGGRRAFGRLARNEDEDKNNDKISKRGGKKGSGSGHINLVTNDGAAMSDNFYNRNMTKEYDDLDYDANEQFADDDVNAGEEPDESPSDDGGFAGDVEDQGDEDDEDDEDGKGFASSTSFKDYLRRKENVEAGPVAVTTGSEAIKKNRLDEPLSSDGGGRSSDEDFATANRAIKRAKIAAEATSDQEEDRFDSDGLRTLSLDAVRKEIWLYHGQITFKKLNKIFNISKKATADRRSRYMEIVKELCTMKEDKTEGRVLVLKQHYQKGL